MTKSGSVVGLRGLVALGALVFAAGCARGPQVEVDGLPVKRVVVYRNGVAYFERRGEVDADVVNFRLRQENVGDFLATLAIVESGGSTVKAASFPVDVGEREEGGPDPSLESALDAWEGKRPEKKRGLRTVRLELDGGRHDLTIGYLAETPVWRPSYRIVVGDGGKAHLQAWGIVQNLSGEDWKDVEVSLVAGAPIAFESTLGEPVVPPRPVVTDRGEVIASVPEGSTTLAEMPAADAMAQAAEYEAAMEDADEGSPAPAAPMASGFGSGGGRLAAERASASKASPPRKAPSGFVGGVGALRDPNRGAQVFAQTGSTRYDVTGRVTIPDQSATMVLLVSREIPGEAVYLYSPDPGVGESHRHPFRVLRFENASGGLLEKGPIAVFEKGAFLGQGLVDALPEAAKATVPFALVRGISVEPSYESDYRDSRLYAIERGTVTVEQDYTQLTRYAIQNGEKEDVRLLIKHPRNSAARLVAPKDGVEDNLGEGHALVPFLVKKTSRAEFTVEERYAAQRQVSVQSAEARAAFVDYLSRKDVPSSIREPLERVLELVTTLQTKADRERALVSEQSELEKSTRETRLSLEAIEKNTKASDLRAELTERLRKGTARLDEITKELIELRLRRTEDDVRLRSTLQALSVPPPDRRK